MRAVATETDSQTSLVELGSLPPGATFRVPLSGREGRVVSICSSTVRVKFGRDERQVRAKLQVELVDPVPCCFFPISRPR